MAKKSAATEALRAWRERLKLNQSEAAAMLTAAAEAAGLEVEIDAWYLSKLERGVRKPGRVLAILFRDVAAIPVEAWDRPPAPSADETARNAS